MKNCFSAALMGDNVRLRQKSRRASLLIDTPAIRNHPNSPICVTNSFLIDTPHDEISFASRGRIALNKTGQPVNPCQTEFALTPTKQRTGPRPARQSSKAPAACWPRTLHRCRIFCAGEFPIESNGLTDTKYSHSLGRK